MLSSSILQIMCIYVYILFIFVYILHLILLQRCKILCLHMIPKLVCPKKNRFDVDQATKPRKLSISSRSLLALRRPQNKPCLVWVGKFSKKTCWWWENERWAKISHVALDFMLWFSIWLRIGRHLRDSSGNHMKCALLPCLRMAVIPQF